MVIGTNGKPVCCEIWPGNTADVKTLIPVVERIRGRSWGDKCRDSKETEQKKDSVHCGNQEAQGNRDKRKTCYPIRVNTRKSIQKENLKKTRHPLRTRKSSSKRSVFMG